MSLKESKTEVQVQPRVCGEYTLLHCQQFFLAGSTPRMRGIFMQIREKRFAWRFNPAYAGNIAFFQSRKAVYQVQPRVCGEYLLPTPSPDLLLGSTPRMRGIYFHRSNPFFSIRFNPAYAGNISSPLPDGRPTEVQPRVCGEYLLPQTKASR